MGIQIRGLSEAGRTVAAEAAHAGGQFALRDGDSEETVFSTGVSTGKYAAELMLATLIEMGIITNDGFNTEHFQRTLSAIVDSALNVWE